MKAVKCLQGEVIGKAFIYRWFEQFGRKWAGTDRCMHDPDKYTVKELLTLLEEMTVSYTHLTLPTIYSV